MKTYLVNGIDQLTTDTRAYFLTEQGDVFRLSISMGRSKYRRQFWYVFGFETRMRFHADGIDAAVETAKARIKRRLKQGKLLCEYAQRYGKQQLASYAQQPMEDHAPPDYPRDCAIPGCNNEITAYEVCDECSGGPGTMADGHNTDNHEYMPRTEL